MRKSSILTELHHFHDTLNFVTSEETLDLLAILVSQNFGIVLFVNPFLEIESILEGIFFRIDIHQDHVLNLRVHQRFVNNLKPSSFENYDHYTENTSKSKDKNRVNFYTTEMTFATNPNKWFYILCIHSQYGTDSKLPSRLEIAFLLDSDASSLVFN